MKRRWVPATCAVLTGLGLMACSSPSTSTASPTVAAPGCHTGGATVHLVLSDTAPVPLVRVAAGDCLAVTVPRSPFKGTTSEPLTPSPPGRLRLVSDSLLAGGTRSAYYAAEGHGTVTITSTVRIRTHVAVPRWNGVVVIV
jgi:hypothetical protein